MKTQFRATASLLEGMLEEAYLRDEESMEFEEIRAGARTAFDSLLDYPLDFRHAIWEPCTRAHAFVLLLDTDTSPERREDNVRPSRR